MSRRESDSRLDSLDLHHREEEQPQQHNHIRTAAAAGGTKTAGPHYNPIGIYGWRKRCLYFFLLLLAVIVVVNLGLTIWILVVLNFNVDGMGNLRVTDSGLRLEGRAEFIGPLYAQNITSDQDVALTVQSQQSVNITSGGSQLHLGENSLNISTGSFHVHAQRGQSSQDSPPILSVSPESVTVRAGRLEASGTLGIRIEGPVETAQLLSPPNENLRIEAPSGGLDLIGSQGATLQAGFASGVDVSSYRDLTLRSQSGSVVLNASEVQLHGLPVSQPTSSGRLWDDVFEVCACESGSLYLVPATIAMTEGCRADGGICGP